MSTPHFLWADPLLADSVGGMKPDPEKHVSFVNVEPTIGTPLQAHKRGQANIPVQRHPLTDKYIQAYSGIKQVVNNSQQHGTEELNTDFFMMSTKIAPVQCSAL